MATATPSSVSFGEVALGTTERRVVLIQADPDAQTPSSIAVSAFTSTLAPQYAGRTISTTAAAAPFSASIAMQVDQFSGIGSIAVTCTPTVYEPARA